MAGIFESLFPLLQSAAIVICVGVLIAVFLKAIAALANLSTYYLLKSKYKNPDLSLLQALLSERRWHEADQETSRLLLWTPQARAIGFLAAREMFYFPYDVLQSIDDLWTQYSNNQFGFSIQKSILLEGCDSNLCESVMDKFNCLASCIGWQARGQWLEYEELNFTDQAPEGHLPAGRWLFPSPFRSSDSRILYSKAEIFLLLMQKIE